MVLCDTSILVAAINKADNDHVICAELLRSLRTKPVTTWPCFTEAMYLLYSQVGPTAAETLRQFIDRDAIVLHSGDQDELKRACALMRRYADAPMDFADASLVVAAETLKVARILTLDSHFYAYRFDGDKRFDVAP